MISLPMSRTAAFLSQTIQLGMGGSYTPFHVISVCVGWKSVCDIFDITQIYGNSVKFLEKSGLSILRSKATSYADRVYLIKEWPGTLLFCFTKNTTVVEAQKKARFSLEESQNVRSKYHLLRTRKSILRCTVHEPPYYTHKHFIFSNFTRLNLRST